MILMKMIEKEVKAPIFYLIRDLRGSFTAFYWNTLSGFYGHKLKDGYKRGRIPYWIWFLTMLILPTEVMRAFACEHKAT